MAGLVKIVECPRDAWMGLAGKVPAEVKADYLRVLVAAGFRHIDAVSFVRKEEVPQMADSELVLEYMDTPDDVEVMGLVVDAVGAERAGKTGSVQTVSFPYSVSAEFLKRGQGRTAEEALEALDGVGEVAYKAGMEVVAVIAMAFGNPFGEAWDTDEVVAACDLLVDSGLRQIMLEDTAGMATPQLISDVVADAMAVHDEVEIGVHLHARPERGAELIAAAYGAGCRRFEATIGGVGGSGGVLFAGDAMVGNIATEMLVAELTRMGATLGKLQPLDGLVAASAEIARRYGSKVQ